MFWYWYWNVFFWQYWDIYLGFLVFLLYYRGEPRGLVNMEDIFEEYGQRTLMIYTKFEHVSFNVLNLGLYLDL